MGVGEVGRARRLPSERAAGQDSLGFERYRRTVGRDRSGSGAPPPDLWSGRRPLAEPDDLAVALALGGGLVGDAAVVAAVGQASDGAVAAEAEVSLKWKKSGDVWKKSWTEVHT